MRNKDKIADSKLLYGLLAVSVLYFVIKGFQYFFIGSYVPILFILTIIILLSWSFTKSPRAHRRTLRFWAILLLIWAIVRLGLGLLLLFDTTLTESHLREQFGIVPNIISIVMMVIGIQIFRRTKRPK